MDKTSFAYIAGLIDGEGHISLIKHKAYDDRLKKYSENAYVYSVRVGITNTDKGMIDWLVSTVGGNVTKDKSNRTKQIYRWTFNGTSKLEHFLLSVIPYMRIQCKKERAKIVLEYVRLKGERNPSAREEMYHRMRATFVEELPTTNTPDSPTKDMKIESDLIGDYESAPVVTQEKIFDVLGPPNILSN